MCFTCRVDTFAAADFCKYLFLQSTPNLSWKKQPYTGALHEPILGQKRKKDLLKIQLQSAEGAA